MYLCIFVALAMLLVVIVSFLQTGDALGLVILMLIVGLLIVPVGIIASIVSTIQLRKSKGIHYKWSLAVMLFSVVAIILYNLLIDYA